VWGALLIALLVVLFPARTVLAQREVMHASAIAQRSVTAPGDQFAIAVILDFEDGWHSWPNKPVIPEGIEGLVAIPTEVRLAKGTTLPTGVQLYPANAQWPAAHEIESSGFTGDPIKVLSYTGRAVVFVPVTIGADAAAGKVTLALDVPYQACNETMCMQPTSARAGVTFEIGAAGSAVKNTEPESEFTAFLPAVFAKLHAGGTPPDAAAPKGPAPTPPSPTPPGPTPSAPAPKAGTPPTTLFGYTLPDPSGPVGMVVLLLVSMLGGAVMNLTPCVLPVIPIKVMTLTQHAKADGAHGSALRLGLWMALGIVAFWTAVGIPMAFISSALDPSRFIFGVWWVTLGIGIIIVAMGFGIMGMFNLTLPQSVYKVNPKADTPWGSFVFGIMTAVLGLPCFGFVAGGLLAAASTWPPLTTMSVFFGIGAGMAIPFLVLSTRPQLVSKMPRTGPASELVKQVMGLMLLAAAAFFVTVGVQTLIASKPYLTTTMRWWVPGFFLSLAGLWLTVRTFQITRKPVRRVVFAVFSALLIVISVAVAWSATVKERANYIKLQASMTSGDTIVTGAWTHYTPARFEAARKSGKVVVVDFTAIWCLICHTLKDRVLTVDPVNAEFMREDVVVLEVNLDDEEAIGWKFLRDLGRTGIPTLAIFTPGVEQPEIFNAYTSQTVMDALARARANAKK
jgi:thiol:disulfide interchange protein DsbD